MHDRLKLLEDNVAELTLLRKKHTFDEISKEKSLEWALRYGFLESIQIIIDISCHLVSKYNLGNPQTYGECVEFLRKFDYIDEDLENKLIGMIGLRNILAHEYAAIDLEKLYGLLEKLDDIREFNLKIRDII